MVGTNCYVVYNENTKECFVVDPAAPSAPLVEFIQTEGLQLQGILLTHGHFDHIMGIDTLRREWSVPVYASALEQKVLTDANVNLSVGKSVLPTEPANSVSPLKRTSSSSI